MTGNEFKRVFEAAQAGVGTMDDAGALDGLALHKNRVACTLAGCAAFVRYQAAYIFGDGWDTAELSNLLHCFKRVTLLD
jgi:hypothetical protein